MLKSGWKNNCAIGDILDCSDDVCFVIREKLGVSCILWFPVRGGIVDESPCIGIVIVARDDSTLAGCLPIGIDALDGYWFLLVTTWNAISTKGIFHILEHGF